MSKLKFKAEHFKKLCFDQSQPEVLANMAQAIYDKHVEGLPKVWGKVEMVNDDSDLEWEWEPYRQAYSTTTARLEDIKDIKNE